MGCDGGTIPRRNELVKVKRKPETRDQTAHLLFQWRYCNITQQLLQRPIVTCGLGKLYNKSTIIEALISKENLPPHIKNLNDVTELNLTTNPEFTEDAPDQLEIFPYICPITGLEMSGKYRFVALWICGCVFSERALKEINTNSCPKCQNNFQETDVVILNAESEITLRRMHDMIEYRKRRRKQQAKRFKKVKVL